MESHNYTEPTERIYTDEEKAAYIKRQQQRRARALTKTTAMKYTEALRFVQNEARTESQK